MRTNHCSLTSGSMGDFERSEIETLWTMSSIFSSSSSSSSRATSCLRASSRLRPANGPPSPLRVPSFSRIVMIGRPWRLPRS